MHAVYRPAENQATITITDTTPGIIAAILTDHDTPASPATSNPATDQPQPAQTRP